MGYECLDPSDDDKIAQKIHSMNIDEQVKGILKLSIKNFISDQLLEHINSERLSNRTSSLLSGTHRSSRKERSAIREKAEGGQEFTNNNSEEELYDLSVTGEDIGLSNSEKGLSGSSIEDEDKTEGVQAFTNNNSEGIVMKENRSNINDFDQLFIDSFNKKLKDFEKT